MEWQSILNDVLNNPLAQEYGGKVLGLNKPAPAPKAPTPVIQVANPIPAESGMSQSKILMIAGGALAVVLVLVFALKKR